MAFVWKFDAGLSKLHSTFPMELFEKKFNLNFFSFSDTLRRYFGILPKKWQSRQKCNLRIHRNTWRVVFEKNVFSSFPDIERNYFNLLSKSFSWEIQKCNLRIHMINLGKIPFSGKSKIFNLFLTLRENFFGHLEKYFWRNHGNCILRVNKILLGKIFFGEKIIISLTLSDIERKGLILSSKFYEKVFKAAVYVSTGSFLVEMLLEKLF